MKWTEKRPSPAIVIDCFGVPAAAPGKWLGVYQHPDVGVRFVRDRMNCLRLFADAESAQIAAKDALLHSLRKREPIRVTREFVPAKRRVRWT
jgi:hypothetical protein